MSDARYPIGAFSFEHIEHSPALRMARLETMRALPDRLREAVDGLLENDLERTYRPGGWTIRQIVHHIPDSHLGGFVRFKWALSEDTPTIKPYDADAWAMLPDSRGPIDHSLRLLDALHSRWMSLLEGMSDADYGRSYVHPEHARDITLDDALANYAWHGDHHVPHIRRARVAAVAG